MSEIKKSQVDIKDLNEKSESLTDRFENIENKLGLKNKSDLLSDDIRGTYFKIKNQARDGKNNNLENEYNNILSNYSKLAERNFSSKQEYLLAGRQLLLDLGNLKTNSGEKLKDAEIDGSIFDAIGAAKDGTINAISKIKQELESTIKMLVSPDQWGEILSALGKALLHPIDTMKGLINGISEQFSDIGRDINLIREKSSKAGFAIEMSEYIPTVAIPQIADLIGPLNFFAILKIDKFLPIGLLKKIEQSEKKVNSITGINVPIIKKGFIDTLSETEILTYMRGLNDETFLNPQNINLLEDKIVSLRFEKQNPNLKLISDANKYLRSKINFIDIKENEAIFNSIKPENLDVKRKLSFKNTQDTFEMLEGSFKKNFDSNLDKALDVNHERAKIVDNINLNNINDIIRDNSFFEKMTLTHKEIINENRLNDINILYRDKLKETVKLAKFGLENYDSLSINQKVVLRVHLSHIVKNNFIISDKIGFKNLKGAHLITKANKILDDRDLNALVNKLGIDKDVKLKLQGIRDKRLEKVS